jgi:hypothetical protein
MKRIYVSMAVLICLVAVAASPQPTSNPTTNGHVIVDSIVNNDPAAAIKEIERFGGEELAGSTKAKLLETFNRMENKFTGRTLVEVAAASDALRREPWLLTGPSGVVRVQFVFYLGADGGPKLVKFRQDREYWDMPWTPLTSK